MPRPMQHPRQAPRGTGCNVACAALLPLSTSRKHVPVSVGAEVHLRPGREAAERGRGMGQVTLWRGTCRPGQIMERRITGVVGGRPAMDKALTIRVRRGPGHTILTAAGEIDIATVARFRARLFALAGEGRPVIADLDQVSFIDASGLGALVGAARRAAAHGTNLHVVCARSQTRQLFHLTGLDRQLHLARTLTEALQALTAAGTPTCELPQPAPASGTPG